MSVAVAAAVSLGLGVLVSLVRPRFARVATGVGLVGLIAVAWLASEIRATDVLPFGSAALVGSETLRSFAATWAACAALLVAIDALSVGSLAVAGPALIGLGAAILAIASTDASAAFAFLAAGGVVAVVAPAVAGARTRALVAWRALRTVVVASFLGLGVIAWESSPAGPFAVGSGAADGVDPAAASTLGLGLIAIVAAVALRMGAIPTHVWAARLVEAIPAAAVPAALAWGGAAFAIVAAGWAIAALGPGVALLGVERGLVAIVAGGTIVLGATAALLHDDIDHVIGYTIVAAGGFGLLAFATLDPSAAPLLAAWLVAYGALASGFAGWATAVRGRFGVRTLAELHGWARRSPLLATALVLVTAGLVGLPAGGAAAARGGLVGLALDPPYDAVALLGALGPALVFGRVLRAGLERPSDVVARAPSERPRLDSQTRRPTSTRSPVALARAVATAAKGERTFIAASLALALAVLASAVSLTSTAAPGSKDGSPVPSASPAASTFEQSERGQSPGASAQRSMSRS